MFNLAKFFGPQNIYKYTTNFYQSIVGSLFFSLMLIPWFLLNGFLKFNIGTAFIYTLFLFWLLPNIQVYFEKTKIYKEEQRTITFKDYWQSLKKVYQNCWLAYLIMTIIASILIFEICVIVKNAQLIFLLPLFFIIVCLLSGLAMHSCYLNTMNIPLKNSVKLAFYVGCRSFHKTLMIALLFLLWFSIGYFIPIANILFGNIVIFNSILFLSKRSFSNRYIISD